MRWNRPALARRLLALAVLALAGCSGGGGGGTTQTTPAVAAPVVVAPVAPAANVATIVVDGGPAALAVGPKGYMSEDAIYVSVTLCVPGTTTCQTIDHIAVDTGSVGLRIAQGVVSASFAASLPLEIDASANPVGECFGFVDGYTFGSVRTADFQIGGEKVAAMPVHVIGDTDRFAGVPLDCSAGGGRDLVTAQDLGANGILGIGVTATDCGSRCTVAGGSAAATYYDCPPTGCSTIIARAATTTAPFEQLPNPVAAMAVDNNGTVISLPAVPDAGARSVTGTLYFGIGTQTNNALGTATVLTTTTSTSAHGPGAVTIVYKAQSLTDSFIDSGSNAYYFTDAAIPQCTDKNLTGYYCPVTPLTLMPVVQGRNGLSATPAITLFNAKTQFTGTNAAIPGIGADPTAISTFAPVPRSFDLGLPFFFGRSVFTAIEGRTAGTTVGPYIAF